VDAKGYLSTQHAGRPAVPLVDLSQRRADVDCAVRSACVRQLSARFIDTHAVNLAELYSCTSLAASRTESSLASSIWTPRYGCRFVRITQCKSDAYISVGRSGSPARRCRLCMQMSVAPTSTASSGRAADAGAWQCWPPGTVDEQRAIYWRPKAVRRDTTVTPCDVLTRRRRRLADVCKLASCCF